MLLEPVQLGKSATVILEIFRKAAGHMSVRLSPKMKVLGCKRYANRVFGGSENEEIIHLY